MITKELDSIELSDCVDHEGYPKKSFLEAISQCDNRDFFDLIPILNSAWWAPDFGFRQEWIKDELHGKWVLKLSLSTGGWSGNESIISALQSNLFFMTSFYSHHRGGHYVFYINPSISGFYLVKDYCKKHSISRQAVHKSKHLYEWIEASHKRKFIRKKLVNPH